MKQHPRFLLPTLIVITTASAVVSSLGAPLVPRIAAEYGVSLHGAQWTLTGPLIVGAVAAPLLGRLGGGRRRRMVVLTGIGVVTAGALVSALPFGFESLLAGRLAQGVGLGLSPLVIGAARDAIPAHRLDGPLAVLSVSMVVGVGAGYPLSGLIAQRWGVSGAFWSGAAVCLVTFMLALATFPRATTPHDGKVDWVGAPLLAGGTATFLLTMSQGAQWGWLSLATLSLGMGSVALLISWIRWSLISEDPIVDLRLALRPGLIAANFTSFAAGMGMYIMITLTVVAVQDDDWGLGSGAAAAGLLLVPYSLTSVLGSRIALAIGRRTEPFTVLPVGCTIYIVSVLAMTQFHSELWQLLLGMSLGGLGSGCTFSAMPSLVVQAVPAHETGSAMAFNQVVRYLGFSVGATVSVAVLGWFDSGHPSERGFHAGLLVAAGIMLATLVGNLALARRS